MSEELKEMEVVPASEQEGIRSAVPDEVFKEIANLPPTGRPTNAVRERRNQHLVGLVVGSSLNMEASQLHINHIGKPWIKMWKMIAASQGLTLRAWVLKTLAAQVEIAAGIPRAKEQKPVNGNPVDEGPPKMELTEAMQRLFPAELAQRLQQNLNK